MEQVYKYTNYEKVKVTNNSGVFQTINQKESHLLSFGKGKLQSSEISCKLIPSTLKELPSSFSFLPAVLQLVPHLKLSNLNNRRGVY